MNFPKYFDGAADRLTEEGERVFSKLGLSLSRDVRQNHDEGLQAMVRNLTVSDVVVLCESVQDSSTK